MEYFDFYFGVELGRKVLSMADNLSEILQGETISASEGQSVVKMTITAQPCKVSDLMSHLTCFGS